MLLSLVIPTEWNVVELVLVQIVGPDSPEDFRIQKFVQVRNVTCAHQFRDLLDAQVLPKAVRGDDELHVFLWLKFPRMNVGRVADLGQVLQLEFLLVTWG